MYLCMCVSVCVFVYVCVCMLCVCMCKFMCVNEILFNNILHQWIIPICNKISHKKYLFWIYCLKIVNLLYTYRFVGGSAVLLALVVWFEAVKMSFKMSMIVQSNDLKSGPLFLSR